MAKAESESGSRHMNNFRYLSAFRDFSAQLELAIQQPRTTDTNRAHRRIVFYVFQSVK
jgi:hypothetical protein